MLHTLGKRVEDNLERLSEVAVLQGASNYNNPEKKVIMFI